MIETNMEASKESKIVARFLSHVTAYMVMLLSVLLLSLKMRGGGSDFKRT